VYSNGVMITICSEAQLHKLHKSLVPMVLATGICNVKFYFYM